MNTLHGGYNITISDNIISIVAKGAFNEIGFQGIAVQLRELVSNLSGAPFYILVDLSELDGATPEAFNELEILNQWLNTQNMQAKALVINSAVNEMIIKKRTPALQKQNVQRFTDRLAAQQWLNLQIQSNIMPK